MGRLAELVAIESVSLEPGSGPELKRAARWLRDEITRGGGHAELAGGSPPLVVGALRNSHDAADAPTILIYGHYDVQPAGDLDEWHTPPFAVTQVGERVFGRGIADDKGQLYMLVTAALQLANEGRLPVDVAFLIDGEEETGGQAACDYVHDHAVDAQACVIFDSGGFRAGQPAITVGGRGNCTFRVGVWVADEDLHSGKYGGGALNAAHILHRAIANVIGPDGRLPRELYAGARRPSKEDEAAWAELPSGRELLAARGASPSPGAEGPEFHRRTQWEPAIELVALNVGSVRAPVGSIPARAQAVLSIRLAPGQTPSEVISEVTRLLTADLAPGARLQLEQLQCVAPGETDPAAPALAIAADAFRSALGVEPVFMRSGGTQPIMTALSERGIPTILTGFALPESQIHAANESLRAADLDAGVRVAREMLTRLAALERADA
jgi:acetylornithine deacetylase/succinyl-diaminopimelate desuccinylase-like protein